MLSRRVGGFAGLGFVALVGSVNIILGSAGMPQAGASPAEVREFFADHGGAVTAASSIATLVWVCLAVFAAGLVARLRPERPERVESWPLLGLAGALMQNAIFAGVVGTQVVLASGTLSDDSFWAVWQLHNALFTLNGTSLALILLAFSVAGLRGGLIRRWHGGARSHRRRRARHLVVHHPLARGRRVARPLRPGRLPDVAGLGRPPTASPCSGETARSWLPSSRPGSEPSPDPDHAK